MSDTRAYPAAALLPDGRVLVAGGWNTLGAARASAEIYDPKTDTWRMAAAMRFSRAEHTAILLPKGLVLVVGGYGDDGLRADAELYDPATDTWAPAGALRTGRGHHTATLLSTGQVLVVGGWDDQNRPLASTELYDPASNTWTPAAGLTTARLDHTATLLPDGTLLAAGGHNGAYLASAEVYDPATAAWSATGAMNVARAYHAAVLLRNGKLLVAGGADGLWPQDTAETYHPQSRNWTPTGQLHKAYESHLALLLRDGKVLIAGRPDSGDRTGNGGYPTPTPTVATQRTPQPLDWLLTPLPTATRKASQGAGTAELAVVAETTPEAFAATELSAAGQVALESNNYTTGDTAKLYSVHEINFTLERVVNPYAITRTVLFTPLSAPNQAPNQAVMVMAFYDGPSADRDLWRARVYVNWVGTWTWVPPAGAWDVATGQALTSGSFTASEDRTVGLHGMLRVSSYTPSVGVAEPTTIPGAPKRWYTDDGQAFQSRADTAYRLFFESPTTTNHDIPTGCPPVRTTPAPTPTPGMTSEAEQFISDYAQDAVNHGLNVLRVLSLGTWAYEVAQYSTPIPTPPNTPQPPHLPANDCVADLSLFWSTAKDGSSNDLFDELPTGPGNINATTYYPNLQSFQRTDRKLKQLLNEQPELYIQMLLVPEPALDAIKDHTWLAIPSAARTQLWRNMVARWAAFPNVFWSISNDLGDTATAAADPFRQSDDPIYTNTITLADEVGCYIAGDESQIPCHGITGQDPWLANRPLSLGHLRYRDDSSVTKPWHTYITAYAAGDISAQLMDGTERLPPTQTPTAHMEQLRPYNYSSQSKPTFNVEDHYEVDLKAAPQSPPSDPSYYYRRLFWSYLLSGGGATYGDYATYEGGKTYTEAGLTGLEGVKQIPAILADAQTDLALFTPADSLITVVSGTPPGSANAQDWADFNRSQVARRDLREILAYIPHTSSGSISLLEPSRANAFDRDIRWARPSATNATMTVDMTDFTDTNYVVTWYRADTGEKYVEGPFIRGKRQNTLTAHWAGDVVLHISSRCTDPNKCLSMDEILPPDIQTGGGVFAGFQITLCNASDLIYTSTLKPDADRRVLGNSWRCDGLACQIGYEFSQGKNVASAGVYFRFTYPSREAIFIAFSTDAHLNYASEIAVGDGDLLISDSLTGDFRLIPKAAPDAYRWYYLEAHLERTSSNQYRLKVFLDGLLVYDFQGRSYPDGDHAFSYVTVGLTFFSDYWHPRGTAWLDELSIDPETTEEARGLQRAFVQQGLGGYTGTTATWLDASGGYNNTNTLLVGQNGLAKSLLRFDLATLPTNAIVDEAILQLYYTSRSNGNSLTLGAHQVLADWVDNQVTWPQRKTGVNWNVAGLGSGSDYAAAAAATVAVPGAAAAWVDLNITSLAQAWVSNPAANLGLALTQEASSGYVNYSFCSELGWNPCTAEQAPKLTLRYHLVPPPPVKATFQRGVDGYTGNQATWLDASGGYNNTTDLLVGEGGLAKTLLKFDVATIPITATVDEATLRLYQTGRSNGNTLTLGAHQVLAAWTDSQANWPQRQTGVNWGVAGMGSGNDYLAAADGTVSLASAGGAWVDLDVKAMTQAWVNNPTANHGLVLTQDAASGYVYYTFCSELGWNPCSAIQAPKLTIWYH